MNQASRSFQIVFTAVMLIFVLFLVWYLPAAHDMRFRLEDAEKSLETSRGRERKQQYEYDETVAALPVAEAELQRVSPLADDAELEVKQLKEERKNLRQEKKELESLVSGNTEDPEVPGRE